MSKINLNTFDLTQLLTQEDDNFEFKQSQTKLKELKKKLSCAVSGFANSGGGCFIAGVGNLVDEVSCTGNMRSAVVGHKFQELMFVFKMPTIDAKFSTQVNACNFKVFSSP